MVELASEHFDKPFPHIYNIYSSSIMKKAAAVNDKMEQTDTKGIQKHDRVEKVIN